MKPQEKIITAKRLAELMACKARKLQQVVEIYLTANGDKPSPLFDLMQNIKNTIMPEIEIKEFSDIFAQTLTYGMFIARLNITDTKCFSYGEASKYIPQNNPFLRDFFVCMTNNLEKELQQVINDIVNFFKSVDIKYLMTDYGNFTSSSDPITHFYEDFLREYDAKLKKKNGVWYTPIQVVKFMVSAVDWLLNSHFGIKNGIADSSMIKKGVHCVQILDPATGTGTFLSQIIRQIKEKFNGNNEQWTEYVIKDLLPRLSGFELMMVSYMMAHIKLDFVLNESGITPTGKECFRLFLTDSLKEYQNEFPIVQPQDNTKQVTVIIGNPPYLGKSKNQSEWILRLIEDYKVQPGGKHKLNEKKQWLSDDYVKFIRLAEYYIEKSGSGIVAYITNHGFLDGLSFRGMRWHLMQTFGEIWIINLHGNMKKKEISPNGEKDENVFPILEGVAITIMIKKPISDTSNARVFYADLWGKREDKLTILDTANMQSIKWQELSPSGKFLSFVPFDRKEEKEWNMGFAINELMPINTSGVATSRDDVVVNISKDELVSRIKFFCSPQVSESQVRARFWGNKKHEKYLPGDTRDWKLPIARAKIANNNHCQFVKSYLYRPFDYRFIYYCKDMVARQRCMKHFCYNNMAFIIGRQGQAVGTDEWNLVLVTDRIVDMNMFRRGGGQVFPLWLYEENIGIMEKQVNMNKTIVAKISDILGYNVLPEDIFAYIYGVLYTPRYRKKFKEFLKTDFPRIPYPRNKTQFQIVAELGRLLIEVHLMRGDVSEFINTVAKFTGQGNNQIGGVQFTDEKVYINDTQYFNNVPKTAWEMQFGGIYPSQKWLLSRKGITLTYDDISHYQRVIITLIKTVEIMKKLDAVGGI